MRIPNPDLTLKTFEAILELKPSTRRIPLAGGPIPMVREGAVLTAASDQEEEGTLAAGLADKVLKGAPAGTIPVVTTKTSLVVNYTRARELGLDPPEGLLKQAAEVIR